MGTKETGIATTLFQKVYRRIVVWNQFMVEVYMVLHCVQGSCPPSFASTAFIGIPHFALRCFRICLDETNFFLPKNIFQHIDWFWCYPAMFMNQWHAFNWRGRKIQGKQGQDWSVLCRTHSHALPESLPALSPLSINSFKFKQFFSYIRTARPTRKLAIPHICKIKLCPANAAQILTSNAINRTSCHDWANTAASPKWSSGVVTLQMF